MNQFKRKKVLRMNLKTITGIKRVVSIAALSLFTACGSGGGGGGGDVVTYDTQVERDIQTELNTIRQNAGAGALTQNLLLDAAAASHANYLVNNGLVNPAYLTSIHSGILGGHWEDPDPATQLPGYTGSTPEARATAAGYSVGSVSENLSIGATTSTDCTASIENSVYHLIQFISPFSDMGLSFNAGGAGGSVCAIELGVSGTGSARFPAAGSWVSYPANAQTNVAPRFYNRAESPSPASDLDGVGHPIAFSLYNNADSLALAAADIVLHTFTLETTSGPVAVPARILAQPGVTTDGTALTSDSNILKPGFLVLLPESPLVQNTNYTVTFSATATVTVMVNGVSTPTPVNVDKSWTFTTGALN